MLATQTVKPGNHLGANSPKKLSRGHWPYSLNWLKQLHRQTEHITSARPCLPRKIAQFPQLVIPTVDRLLILEIVQFSWASLLLPSSPLISEIA